MSVFISKIQHDTFEKGEFREEQVRSLSDTLELIKGFPWDAERSLTDIKLTGPSVTIQNEQGDFLKVAIYFNNKFCMYYLRGDVVYEYVATDIEDVIKEVTDFYNDVLNSDKYHHDLFKIGARSHFESNAFEYQIKFWRVFLLNIFLILIAGMFLVFDIAILRDLKKVPLVAVFVLISSIFFVVVGKILSSAISNRGNYLQISKGSNIFLFGYTSNTIKTYDKPDVLEIISYEFRGIRNPNLIEVYEIFFIDGSRIKFSNMLISGSDLLEKFCDKMDNLQVKVTSGKGGLFKAL